MKTLLKCCAACLFFIIIGGSMLGCNAIKDPFGYCEAPFSARAKGEVDGVSVEVILHMDPVPHNTKEIYDKLTVTYLAPASLRGITVSLRSDGTSSARLGDLVLGEQNVRGMLEIFLLLCPNEPPSSLQMEGEHLVVNFDEYTLTFLRDGEFPVQMQGTWGERRFLLVLSDYSSRDGQD